MTVREPIDPNAYEETDELVLDEGYDPLADADAEGVDPELVDRIKTPEDAERAMAPAEEDVLPYLGTPDDAEPAEAPRDERPAAERIADLFGRMKTRRKTLLAVLDMCREPAEVDAVNDRVAAMLASSISVFDGPALTSLLERAGAIEKVAGEEQEPKVVVEDGVEYLEPAEPVAVRYRTTPDGLAVLDADKPMDRLHARFEKEAVYKPIYLRVLKACSEEGGKSAKELGDLVNDDPLLQKPRFWAAHFFNALGECDALTWDHTWQITDLGWKAIEELELEGVE